MEHVQPLLASLESFQAQFERLEGQESELLALRDRFVSSLAAIPASNDTALNEESALYQQNLRLRQALEQSISDWASRWEQASPMRVLSETFADRVIFLVFGKVKAGKSTFCNFVAEQFPAQSVRRFYLNNGEITYFDGEFKEGVNETTARIQGMELGPRLVLLDSPGLHSVTEKNGELTRRFTDSADAVLWLTSSKSPGQVQELDDLRIELKSQKPLLPVLTGSDETVEDVNEHDELVQTLINKSSENRTLQEEDVTQRAVQKLGSEGESKAQLKAPVSVSVHAFKSSAGTARDFAESGLSRLVEQLVPLLDESRQYKAQKATRQVMNFLDGVVRKQLAETILPEVVSLQSEAQKAKENLSHRQRLITSQVVSEVCVAIPMLVERHRANRDEKSLAKDLNQQIEQALNTTLQQELAEFTRGLERVCSSLNSSSIGQFEDMTVEVRRESGSRSKATTTVIGTLLGGVVGSILLPGAGTVIGSTLGGMAGNKIGDNFIQVSYEKEVVGVSSAQIVDKTTDSVNKQLPKQIDRVVQKVIEAVSAQEAYAQMVMAVIEQFQRDVETRREIL